MKVLRLPAVIAKVGFGHSKVYEEVAKAKAGEGDFPLPIPLGPKIVGWLDHELDEYIERRIAERDGKRVESKEERVAQ
jgi:prophage regulatory protein